MIKMELYEKVDKGLNCCSDICSPGCPYSDIMDDEDSKLLKCYRMLISDAITLIHEQQAKITEQEKSQEILVIMQNRSDEYYGLVAQCPNCQFTWINGDDDEMHYCPKCGKPVMWI